MTSALLELADRCATVGGRYYNPDLDADIYEALGYSVIRGTGHRIYWRYRGHGPFGFVSHWSSMLSFTYKLDDAMKLVPDDWTAVEIASRQARSAWKAEVSRLESGEEEIVESGRCKTPALALTAACLRAHASMSGESKGAEGNATSA